MAQFRIDKKLVVAISSSAVFDMKDAGAIYDERGEEVYRNFQKENVHTPFEKGVAFPFIRRLLHFNHLYPKRFPAFISPSGSPTTSSILEGTRELCKLASPFNRLRYQYPRRNPLKPHVGRYPLKTQTERYPL